MASKTPRKARPATTTRSTGPLTATELARLHAWTHLAPVDDKPS